MVITLFFDDNEYLRVMKLYFKQNAITRTTHDIFQAAIYNRQLHW